jgi:hypothetical protein
MARCDGRRGAEGAATLRRRLLISPEGEDRDGGPRLRRAAHEHWSGICGARQAPNERELIVGTIASYDDFDPVAGPSDMRVA